jgi:hypothetical protein
MDKEVDETVSLLKGQALWQVAKALAASDPDRAEDVARSITNEIYQAWALAEVAKVLAASDPDRAARLARSITDEKTQAEVLAEAAKAWLQGWVSLWPVPGSICRHAQTTRPT